MLLIGILTGLIILVILVVIHELGHAISARRNGVVVQEFGIGFPPRAWARKIKQSILGSNVLLSINWLPLGGFVRLQGEYDSAKNKGDYGAATYWQKTKILLAGVLMNWATAAVIFTILAFVGLPKLLPNQFSIPSDTITTTAPLTIASIEKGSPADLAGLRVGDRLLLIGSSEVETAAELSERTKENKGAEVQLTYSRGDQEYTTKAVLRTSVKSGQGFLGVGTSQQRLSEIRATWSAPIVGVGTTIQMTVETFKGLGILISDLFRGDVNEASNKVSGPVGILGVIFPAFQQAGIKMLLLLTGIISLSLAVMNALPIPALDGGRWFTMTIFRILKKPLTKEREESIQAVGFLLLMGLIILVTVADVSKLIG